MIQEFKNISSVKGELKLLGDKSVSHRSVMFSAMAKGESKIYNCLMSEDVLRTIAAFREMGCKITIDGDKITVIGKGINGLQKPEKELYLGNSGTTARLIVGILSAQSFSTKITGDPSLSSRPMKRIIDPLKLMGADIESKGGLLPLKINSVDSLKAIEYELPIASAQIKSCILLAALYSEEETVVIENKKSRNHTELMLNLKVVEEGSKRKIYSSSKYYPTNSEYIVPSDISTAAFFMVLTLLLPNSKLTLKNISLNDTRVGIISVLQKMGGDISICNIENINREKRGDIIVKSSNLVNIDIDSEVIPNIIDEIPILSIAGLFAEGNFKISNAFELRHKESDRINSVCKNLKLLGVEVKEYGDGFEIIGTPSDKQVLFDSYDDHRIAMSFSIFSLLLKQGGRVKDFDCVNISNPEFISQLDQICG